MVVEKCLTGVRAGGECNILEETLSAEYTYRPLQQTFFP